jgi:hypothetical protein
LYSQDTSTNAGFSCGSEPRSLSDHVLAAKRLELLKEAVPSLVRAALLLNPDNASSANPGIYSFEAQDNRDNEFAEQMKGYRKFPDRHRADWETSS